MSSMEPFKDASALVIDDNEHMVAITAAMLRAFGFGNVLCADDAPSALDLIDDSPVDLIVVDYRMPEMDGIAFVTQLRREDESPNRFVPIIMLTAHSEHARICQARDSGVTEFLCKPLAATELFKKIASAVDHPRPFVCAEDYVGPDRRRKPDPEYKGPERRKNLSTVFVDTQKSQEGEAPAA